HSLIKAASAVTASRYSSAVMGSVSIRSTVTPARAVLRRSGTTAPSGSASLPLWSRSCSGLWGHMAHLRVPASPRAGWEVAGAGRQQGVTVDAAGTHQPDHPHPYLGGLDRVRARAMTRAVVAGGSRLNKAGGLRLPDCTSGTRRGQRSPAGVVGSHRPRSARPPARPGRDCGSRLVFPV